MDNFFVSPALSATLESTYDTSTPRRTQTPVLESNTLAQTTALHGSESNISLRNVAGPTSSSEPTTPTTQLPYVAGYFTARDPLDLAPRRKSEEEIRQNPKKVRNFYRDQNKIIDNYLEPIDKRPTSEDLSANLLRLKIAVRGSMAVNIILFGLQLYAAISSGSLSLFATMADSFMDILSNSILLFAGRAANAKNILRYPTGKSRMETAGIIVFSSLMCTVSIELIIEAIKNIVGNEKPVDVHPLAVICVGSALGAKFLLFLYCFSQRQFPSARILAQDHRNDLFINSIGLTMSLLSKRVKPWMDPVGAIIVALFILRSWITTAYEQIQLIVGKSADSGFLNRVTYIALTHHPKVLQVDTCKAYHAGNNFFVEVDIVMDRETPLWESHDIGESLQIKLEKLINVERAFVHVDYETSHKPEHHKEE
ncbi:cation efflux family-domain-containing protein [Glomus cerebriforme]|uniref:Cation efflux family-domain-containing protein n=1 Tax=Glomus cerebriforme TaxID=658196 RepID=A0A397TAX1_9GLOM|nr:cation efflux family-domain-containing protein [Glomus cerebriforme]